MKKIIFLVIAIAVIYGAYSFITKTSSSSRSINTISDLTNDDREFIAEAIARSSAITKSGDVDDIRDLMIKKAGDDSAKIASIKKISDNSIRQLSSFTSASATITKDMVLQSTDWSVFGNNKVVVKVRVGNGSTSSLDAVYNGGKWY